VDKREMRSRIACDGWIVNDDRLMAPLSLGPGLKSEFAYNSTGANIAWQRDKVWWWCIRIAYLATPPSSHSAYQTGPALGRTMRVARRPRKSLLGPGLLV
jgi:hypothetical protein